MTDRTNQERETYWSRFAADFSTRNRYVVGAEEMELLKNHLRRLGALGDTLELGCGDGEYTPDIAAGAARLVATDWSAEMLAAAACRLTPVCPEVVLQQEDCCRLSFEAGSFDTVVMVNLLHIIHDPEGTLRECRRVLRPQGRLVVMSFTAHGMGLRARLGMIYRYLRSYGKPSVHARNLSVEAVTDMLAGQGFVVETAELVGRRMKSVLVDARLADSRRADGCDYRTR